MKFINYLLFRIVKIIATITPFKLLYLFSDFCSFVMQFIVRYRQKIIWENLRKSFPIKSKRKIRQIICGYYQYMCDLLLESIKGYSVDTKELMKRYHCVNPEVANKYFDKGQDVIIALSHYGNWEWGTQVASTVYKFDVVTFYKPLTNEYIDKYMYDLRHKRDMALLSIYETHRATRAVNERPKAYFMVSDQSPENHKKAYWTTFLNQETACIKGVEVYAKLFNMPVIYLDVQRLKRGYYRVEMEEICSSPKTTDAGEITEKYMKKLESIIATKPENWLWSHRRWKVKRAEI